MPTFAYAHRSVMVEEVLAHLLPRPGGVYCDATVGGGGHAERVLLASAPDGLVVGIDRDPEALAAARQRLLPFGARFLLVQGAFGDLPEILAAQGLAAVDGIIADLGVSSPQLDQPGRGFSFQRSGPIDMRMDPEKGETALQLIERLLEEDLAAHLRTYGEERFARRIAGALKRAAAAGELSDTLALQRVVAGAVPSREPGKDPATRTFQALRIAVNDELRQVDRLMQVAPRCLKQGGRLVLISFHSLEDRIVKHRLREAFGGGVLTRKPIGASDTEVAENPRARSALLRAATLSEIRP